MTSQRLFGKLLATVVLVLGATGAQAALVSCPTDFFTDPTSKVVGTSGATAVSACQYLTPADPSNVASISNINSAGFFGYNNWQSNGQNQIDTDGLSAGNWSITDADFSAFEYIIVFKSGQGTNLTAFLFNGSADEGRWTTPFTKPPFNLAGNSQSRDVSHYTIARRAAVPEPGTLALLGAGLLGLGFARRRRLS